MAQNQQVAKSKQPTALMVIEDKIKSADVQKRLMVALDIEEKDEAGQREAFKYASSVLAEIGASAGTGQYTDLTLCTPDSICKAMIDAAHFRVQIDGRKLAHLEKRGNLAILQIDANGYVAKIQERYKDFQLKVIHKFKGDTLEISGEDGDETYKFASKNPYGKYTDLEGISVYITFTNAGGKLIRQMTNVGIDELKMIATKSRGKAFEEFWKERMGTAAIKRACKWVFRKDATVQAMIDYDNKANFDLDQAPQPAASVRPSIIDNINQGLRGETPDAETVEEESWEEEPAETGDAIPDAEIEESDASDITTDDLIKQGNAAAAEGKESYKDWRAKLSTEQKEAIGVDQHRKWLNDIIEAEENAI